MPALSQFLNFIPELLEATVVTIQITIPAAVLAFVLAICAGLARVSRIAALRSGAAIYVEFFRGTSLLVQFFWLFFCLPLIGITLAPMTVAILGLGLNVGAYGAEVVRGAVQAVARGQYEAATALNMSRSLAMRQVIATALNMSRSLAMRQVILPQALVAMLPPFGNLLIELLKGTALVSLITITDLTFRGAQLNVVTLRSMEIWGLVLIIYFVLAQILNLFVRYMEQRLSVGLGRVKTL